MLFTLGFSINTVFETWEYCFVMHLLVISAATFPFMLTGSVQNRANDKLCWKIEGAQDWRLKLSISAQPPIE